MEYPEGCNDDLKRVWENNIHAWYEEGKKMLSFNKDNRNNMNPLAHKRPQRVLKGWFEHIENLLQYVLDTQADDRPKGLRMGDLFLEALSFEKKFISRINDTLDQLRVPRPKRSEERH